MALGGSERRFPSPGFSIQFHDVFGIQSLAEQKVRQRADTTYEMRKSMLKDSDSGVRWISPYEMHWFQTFEGWVMDSLELQLESLYRIREPVPEIIEAQAAVNTHGADKSYEVTKRSSEIVEIFRRAGYTVNLEMNDDETYSMKVFLPGKPAIDIYLGVRDPEYFTEATGPGEDDQEEYGNNPFVLTLGENLASQPPEKFAELFKYLTDTATLFVQAVYELFSWKPSDTEMEVSSENFS